MAKYYDFAVQRASNCFKRKKGSSAFWDNRIEEENVVRDAAIDALQNVYTKYDPDKGLWSHTFPGRSTTKWLTSWRKR